MLLNKRKTFFALTIFLILLMISCDTFAASSHGILNTVLKDYKDAMGGWAKQIQVYSEWLYWTLVTISMVITFGFMALRKADIGEIFAEFIRFTLFVGFFWWLLINGTNFSFDLISSFQTMGSSISGFGKGLKPSGILDIGFDTFFSIVHHSSWSIKSLVAIIMSIFLLILMTLVAFNMLLLLIQSWLLASAGIFLLGFGGSRWTYEIAINYFKTVLGTALQIFTMILIIGVGRKIILGYLNGIKTASISIEEITVLTTIGLVMYLLTDRLPAFMSGIITGASIGQNAGQAGAGTAMAASAAAMGTAAIAMKSAAAEMAGGTSAVYNSVTQAAANVGEGSDVVSQMMNTDIPGYDGSKNESSSSSRPLAEAMGLSNDSPVSSSMSDKAASFMADTGKMVADSTANLAQGGWNAMKENASDAISSTVGGQIANQIKSSGESSGNNDSAEIYDDGNNLSASFSNTDTTLDVEAEVSAFRDKT